MTTERWILSRFLRLADPGRLRFAALDALPGGW